MAGMVITKSDQAALLVAHAGHRFRRRQVGGQTDRHGAANVFFPDPVLAGDVLAQELADVLGLGHLPAHVEPVEDELFVGIQMIRRRQKLGATAHRVRNVVDGEIKTLAVREGFP